MLGKSIYLSNAKSDVQKTIDSLNAGDWCFTSLHNPEDFVDGFIEEAKVMIAKAHDKGARVVADVSPRGVAAMGYKDLADMAKSGLAEALRCDYGFTAQEIFEASNYCEMVFNASVIDEELVNLLVSKGVKVHAMHNFYPRPETGMDADYIWECNTVLHDNNIAVWAFISGDDVRRGPIYDGLPTVEDHRSLPLYVQYMYLKNQLDVDCVFVGDVSLQPYSEKLIMATEETGVLQLPVKIDSAYEEMYCNKELTIRMDSNRRIARIVESREYAQNGPKVEPCEVAKERPRGAITMDNAKYLRYSGEVQIVREDLPADERVNVIGHVLPEYEGLLDMCEGGTKVKLRILNS